MRNTGAGAVSISWQPVADPLESGATPTGYRVYLSNDGFSFDEGRSANGTNSHVLTGLQPGQTVFARVTAVNAGGESLWSEMTCARTPDAQAEGLGTPLLLVSGYERLDEYTWYQQGATNQDGDMHVRNRRDALRRHALAASQATTTAGGSYFFDSASNEAIESGSVALTGYPLVDWVLGNESTADETFSATEQAVVSAYLAAGGHLFVSGAEIGWDLDAQGTAADRAFFNGPLATNYVSDSSNDYSVDAVSGGLFDGLPSFTFDDGIGSAYTVSYPDVIEPAAGASSSAVLEYSSGVTAGVADSSVVVLGFPFETIDQANARNAFMQRTLRALAPNYTGLNPTPGGASTGSGNSNDSSGCAVAAGGLAPLLLWMIVAVWLRRKRERARQV